jgi:hypothetical protein
MRLTTSKIKCLIKRKIATVVLISASLAAFATLGDGGKDGKKATSFSASRFSSKNFSLRSGYNYKSNDLLQSTNQKQYIVLNTVATYQKGNVTYVMPMKKKVILDKIKFNPAQ